MREGIAVGKSYSAPSNVSRKLLQLLFPFSLFVKIVCIAMSMQIVLPVAHVEAAGPARGGAKPAEVKPPEANRRPWESGPKTGETTHEYYQRMQKEASERQRVRKEILDATREASLDWVKDWRLERPEFEFLRDALEKLHVDPDSIRNENFAGQRDSGFEENLSYDEIAAFKKIEQQDAFVASLKLSAWKFRNPPSFAELIMLINLMKQPLRGELKVATFFDDISFSSQRKTIQQSWTHGQIGRMPHEGLNEFLEAYRDNTLIVISHMEKSDMVIRDSDGTVLASVNLPEFMKLAQEKGVLVIPIGCKSADAGAGIGFIENITTAEVSRFLASLPSTEMLLGDIVRAMSELGTIKLNFGIFSDSLEFATIKQGSDAPQSRFRIDASAFGSNVRCREAGGDKWCEGLSSYNQTDELALADKERFWWDKEYIRPLHSTAAIVFLFLSPLVPLFLGSWASGARSTEETYTTKKSARRLRVLVNLEIFCKYTAGALFLGSFFWTFLIHGIKGVLIAVGAILLIAVVGIGSAQGQN